MVARCDAQPSCKYRLTQHLHANRPFRGHPAETDRPRWRNLAYNAEYGDDSLHRELQARPAVSAARAAEFSAQCRVGRLIEGRLVWLNDVGDVTAFQRVMAEAFAQSGPDAVICADWRRALVFSPQAGEAMIDLLRRGNRQLSRSAVLLSATDATFSLQVERLIREAASPNRRSFRAVQPLLAWLGEVLTPAERARAAAFLAQT